MPPAPAHERQPQTADLDRLTHFEPAARLAQQFPGAVRQGLEVQALPLATRANPVPQQAGRQFDPRVVEVALCVLGER